MKKKKLIQKFNKQAKVYERNRDNRTLAKWRSKIIPDATGKVLEVGVGVGANFPYYNKDVAITAVDFSPEMIKHAEEAAHEFNVPATFFEQDITEVHFEPNSFDTIVSTLTVCGYSDPIATLKKYHNWCKADGKILFLEHGISSNSILSVAQKMINPIFRKVAGCNCNRNIPQLIESVGLEIIRSERYWTNIISLIWAKPIK